ncbi:MAG: hypothetical protein ACXAB8_17685, partial [Promethearchaeota archaeon]
MVINVRIIRGDEIEVENLIQITYQIRKQDLLDKGINFEDLITIFRKNYRNPSIYYVIAYENETIVGWLLLYPTTHKTFEINIGETLGGNPLVVPTYDWNEVASFLIMKAQNFAKKQEYRCIEISVPQIGVVERKSHRDPVNLYQSLGFNIKLKYVEMVYNVKLKRTPKFITPTDLIMKIINEVDEDEIYQCYITSFESGDAKFFMYQTKNERTEYFHTLFEPDILNQEASIVIIKDDQLIGFSYVLEFE